MAESDKARLFAMLAENEDDDETRLVLADLLDELGEDDEAQRHRNWKASKQWMIRFLADVDDTGYAEEAFAYGDLMELLSTVNGSDAIRVHFGAYESLMYAMRERADEFWRHWSIVTGIAVGEELYQAASFGCAC